MTLREQIKEASELNRRVTRLQAVQLLKEWKFTQAFALELCTLFQEGLHPAERTVIAQVLGYHQAAKRLPEVAAILHNFAQKEDDGIALRALVFALQGSDIVTQFVGHRDPRVALEAIIQAPATTPNLEALLKAVFSGLPTRSVDAFCLRLTEFDDIVPHIVAFLMTAEFRDAGSSFDGIVSAVFGSLPQADLCVALVDVRGELERTYKTIWPGIWRRERQRRLLELFLEVVGRGGVEEETVLVVLNRIVTDETTYENYVRFVRSFLAVLNTKSALIWIASCQTLAQKKDRDQLSRLAETLVSLVKSSPLIAEEALALLSEWEPQLPGVRMKAFHATR